MGAVELVERDGGDGGCDEERGGGREEEEGHFKRNGWKGRNIICFVGQWQGKANRQVG